MDSTGPLLKAYRAKHGLSQAQLAERWGVSKRTLQHIEIGARRADDGILIALLKEAVSSA